MFLALMVYIFTGLTAALLGCCLRRRTILPGIVLSGTVLGAIAAYVSNFLFGSIGPTIVGGTSIVPCLAGSVVAIVACELLARKQESKLSEP